MCICIYNNTFITALLNKLLNIIIKKVDFNNKNIFYDILCKIIGININFQKSLQK